MRWVEVCRDHNIHSFISQCAAAVAPLSIGMVTLIMKLRLLPNVPLTRPWLIIEFQETIGGIYLLLQTSSSIHPNNIVIRLRRTWTTHTSKLYGHIPYCEWKSFLGFLSVEFGGCLLCLNRSKGVPNKPITTTLISCQL